MVVRMLRRIASIAIVTAAMAGSAGVARGAGEYPLALTADVSAKTDTVTISAVVTIKVDRLIEENRRKRLTDALKFGGYPKFVTTLREIPAIGSIQLGKRIVEIHYAQEEQTEGGRRLVLVADRPLFFLGDAAKTRAGYELTLVELRFDAQGGVTGQMAGAARVKPAGEGNITLDNFAEILVQLNVHKP